MYLNDSLTIKHYKSLCTPNFIRADDEIQSESFAYFHKFSHAFASIQNCVKRDTYAHQTGIALYTLLNRYVCYVFTYNKINLINKCFTTPPQCPNFQERLSGLEILSTESKINQEKKNVWIIDNCIKHNHFCKSLCKYFICWKMLLEGGKWVLYSEKGGALFKYRSGAARKKNCDNHLICWLYLEKLLQL